MRPRILLLQGTADTPDPVRSLLAEHPEFGVIAGLAACAHDVEERRSSPDPVELVVLSPAVERPLTAGRRLSAADPDVGLVYLVDTSDEVERMTTRLALSPDIRDATVVPAEQTPALLWERLDDVAERARQRRRLGGALDVINRSLQSGTAPSKAPAGRTVVSDRHLAALTRHAPDPIISVDGDLRVVAFNAAAVRTFGLSAEDAEGNDVVALLAWPDEVQKLRDSLDAAIQGRPARVELRLRQASGEPIVVSMTAAPISNAADEVVGVVLMGQDVTDRRRTEHRLQTLQRAETMATLAGGVAHDFNNLLVTILGWADIAGEDPDDPEIVGSALERIRSTAQRASELARQMLAYSGRGSLDSQHLDLDELVRDMVGLLRSSSGRSTPIELELHGGLPRVHVDPTQLRQVVLNLVTNASEAIAERPGTIRVQTDVRELTGSTSHVDQDDRPDLPAGRYATLAVVDTGIGMDPDTMRRVFDPFFSTKFTGRGLGLAATQGIVQAHGGDVTVSSDPDRGSTFVVWLPLDDGKS